VLNDPDVYRRSSDAFDLEMAARLLARLIRKEEEPNQAPEPTAPSGRGSS
jgi:hypothetical protein